MKKIIDEILTDLSAKPHDDLEKLPFGCGIYAIYLVTDAMLPAGCFLAESRGRCIYVGKAEKSLQRRDLRIHFTDNRTGSSTLRRSLGAIFRQTWGLHLVPRRVPPRLKIDVRNFAFEEDDEQRLTKWMKNNLKIKTWKNLARLDLKQIEEGLTEELKPVLNLTGWENPRKEEIKKLRAECRELAREHG